MNCIHDINTVRYVTGLEARRVYAEFGTFATPVEVEDFVVATVRYNNGAIGHVEAGSCIKGAGPDEGPGIRIYGSAGQIVLSSPPRLYSTRASEALQPDRWHDLGQPAALNARQLIVEAFAAAVLAGRQPPVSGQDGRAALEVVLSAYQAGLEGRPVELGIGLRERNSS